MPQAEAIAAAKKIINELSIETPPVPVREIVATRDLKLVERSFPGNVSGMLFRRGNRGVIGVNAAHPKTRQRFTIAHELGHNALHPGDEFVDQIRVDFRDQRASAGTVDQEIEANAFAAELLMPEALVRTEHRQQVEEGVEPGRDDFVTELAIRFDVSLEAMSYRLVNLGLSRQI